MLIVKNAFYTPDGTFLRSMHRLDYQEHTDSKNKVRYFIDGGPAYFRNNSDNECTSEFIVAIDSDEELEGQIPDNTQVIDIRQITVDQLELIRSCVHWGTYGKTGNDPLRYVALKDLEYDHIRAILQTQVHISKMLRYILESELIHRDKNLVSNNE